MLSTPQLQVIVLLNIEPDVPTYPFKQRRLITRIRRELGADSRPAAALRCVHAVDARCNPASSADLPVYIHAKVGIIDNTWATVGSANLDGLSLDSSLPSDILHGLFNRDERARDRGQCGDVRYQGSQNETNVVDILRRKLWAEHLGYLDTTNLHTRHHGRATPGREQAARRAG